MTPRDMMKTLKGVEGKAVWTLSGEVSMRVADHDAKAMRVLEFMEQEWPDLTVGETFDILYSAGWFQTLFSCLQKDDRP